MSMPSLHLPAAVRHVVGLSLLGMAGCGTEPPIATTIILNPASVDFTALGQTQLLAPTVQDENGATMQDFETSWSSSNAAVASVSSDGIVSAVGVGSADIIATVGAATATAPVTVTQNPSQLQKVSGDAQAGTVGSVLPQPLTVELRDALENPIPGVAVTFTVTQGSGVVQTASVTTDASGRASTLFTLGTAAGLNQVSAVSAVALVSAVFLVTGVAGPPAAVAAHSGNGQTAPAGTAIIPPPAVRVNDAFGNPVSGVHVVFRVAEGGGTVTGESTTTNASGIAQVGSWTLGGTGTNTLIATVSAGDIAGNPVTFTATATAGGAYNIQVRFSGSATPAQEAAFAEAEARWESVVIGDVPAVPLVAEAGTCGENSPAVAETVDDVLILAAVEEIDGAGGTLAQAGPCYIRTGGLPVLGLVRFDAADLADIEAAGALSDVILHEMGHVLGIGTLWDFQGLLADPSLEGGTDPHFTGAQAIEAFNAVGGSAYSGAKVPVENSGGAGTADAHWRESVMGNELMTGFVSLGSGASLNPLSIVTIGSLADQGYSVTSATADAYSLTTSLRATSPGFGIRLGDDRLRLPLRRVDPSGRVVQVIPR